MGKAIDVWLTQFGLKAPAESRGERDERSLGAKDQRARRPRPTIVASEPVMMKRPAEGPAVRQRPRNPTMAPGEPRVMKRPIEANAPRSQRRPAPTITLDEPAVTGKKRSPEAINTTASAPARDGYAARRAVREAGRDEATRRADGGGSPS